jgi:hypothetical protein
VSFATQTGRGRFAAGPSGRNAKGTAPMTTIELTAEEQEILAQVLQSSLVTLELELVHTDHLEYKELLKHRRQVLQRLRDKVPELMAAV